jgi:diguanylate cyclase (GGDEF)-like protein/PAS domain S-box-containing protein
LGDPRDAASRRYIARVLKRVGLDPLRAPNADEWTQFLDVTRSLLTDLEQDRYLLEQSLDTSSAEMLSLNVELRATAERLASEREELRQSNSLLAATLESTADGILVVDTAGGITSFNGRFCEMWGLPRDILDTGNGDRALAYVLDQLDDPDAFVGRVHGLRASGDDRSHDTVSFKDGRIFECDSYPQYIEGGTAGRVWSFRDVTEQRRMQDELSHQAFHDPLTNLANRTLLAEHVANAMRRKARRGGHVAVAVVDLDGFKNINDSLGHRAGDDLLVGVAERFSTVLRDFATVARLGGDEFAILVDGLSTPKDVERVGAHILDALASPIVVGDRRMVVNASVGIAVAPDAHTSADTLLGNADVAMYRAKRQGKRCYRVFEPWMHKAAVDRLDLEQALREAVGRRLITVHYQPIIDSATGDVVAFEALARWYDERRGPVRPDVFIPLAEETGLIAELGQSVLIESCRQAAHWAAAWDLDVAPGVAVNVSALQLSAPGFGKEVTAALEATGLDPRSLMLEITESILGHDPAQLVGSLDELRRIGVRIAIDDFGTGYSSFAALAELPVDCLKIDKRFVDRLVRDGRGRAVVQAITYVAQTLGVSTTAEGVEHPEQHDLLTSLGCDNLQGYLFARPLTPDAVATFLDEEVARRRVRHPRMAVGL